ncbi:MAG TPA: molybdopterin dinucleotide binding domain-containing protein, partial [Planctomycetota bacterium]|nr:molybdopterin dinucleotide binding domain-containing protein [Planctomycetota bacterium]
HVAEVTGIPASSIELLAHQMSAHAPAVAFADGQAAAATNGLGTAMAIHALNALLGNCERPGGVWVQRKAPLTPWAAVVADEAAKTGAAMPRLDGAGTAAAPLSASFIQNLPANILAGAPYPIQALFLYKSNPVFSKPAGAQWKAALEKVPLVVSFSPFRDESTFWADYLLPEGTYLERWEIVEPVPNVRYPIVGLRQPVVEPVYNVKSTGDVVISLAQAIGGSVAAAFPWKGYKPAQIERLKGLFAAKSGSVVEEKFGAFGQKIQEVGGWFDNKLAPEDWETAFKTPSGKFEFYSQAIAKQLAALKSDEFSAKLAAQGVVTTGDDLCLPHWEPPRYEGDAKDHQWILVPYRGVEYAEGGARHLPWLVELPIAGRRAWHQRVELTPLDASALGLAEGDLVDVSTKAGGARLTVQLVSGIGPGMVGLPLGHGHWPPRPEDALVGGYGLLANKSDPLAGILSMQETRVRISKLPAS